MKRLPPCVSVLLVMSPALIQAAVVDLFDSRPQIAATGDPVASSVSSATSDLEAFELRRLAVPYGGGRLQVTSEERGLSFLFLTEMATGGNTLGYLSWRVSSDNSVSLNGSGENALRFVFSDLQLPSAISFQINLTSEGGNDSLQVYLPAGERASEVLEVPFSSFDGVDFSGVRSVGLSGGRFFSGTAFVLDSVTSVPEPSLPMLGMSLVLLLCRRRR